MRLQIQPASSQGWYTFLPKHLLDTEPALSWMVRCIDAAMLLKLSNNCLNCLNLTFRHLEIIPKDESHLWKFCFWHLSWFLIIIWRCHTTIQCVWGVALKYTHRHTVSSFNSNVVNYPIGRIPKLFRPTSFSVIKALILKVTNSL